MTDHEYCSNWRQVRLFSREPMERWYADLLATAVRSLADLCPDLSLFVSRYVCPLGHDDGDTDIERLPADFLRNQDGKSLHCSVRVRFRPSSIAEEFLGALRRPLWHAGIRDYDIERDLGGPRFAPNQSKDASRRRARLVAELLSANTRLILDALETRDDATDFEVNPHELNSIAGSTFVSIGHMLCNAWSLRQGQPVPVYVLRGRLVPL